MVKYQKLLKTYLKYSGSYVYDAFMTWIKLLHFYSTPVKQGMRKYHIVYYALEPSCMKNKKHAATNLHSVKRASITLLNITKQKSATVRKTGLKYTMKFVKHISLIDTNYTERV